ncbi:epsin-3 [Punica granatum]|uniref:Epsin-3 n=2 Tax=Punica granatum TaxID=22663 RepID=A0A6P8CYQ4_PUNGR|nr:epsin-3 [Punica granatum]PKI61708.1 hypothetical protein CRG98_017932 [Punica granatum]
MMSILQKNSMNNTMSTAGTPFFREFKKQASFFLKEKIKSARLALTDVTPIQLLTEEAVSGDQLAPDTQTLGRISKAAFEVDDYWRIVDILHSRLSRFERKNWRESYHCLIVLEHLLTHGPESVAEEFQADKEVISRSGNFQYIDEKGFNWGLAVRKKSERVLKLLEQMSLLKEEREKARKLTRGIQGFGSFSQRAARSTQGILKESSLPSYVRSNSDFNPGNQDNQFLPQEQKIVPDSSKVMETPGSENCLGDGQLSSGTSLKENVEPCQERYSNREEVHQWIYTEPSRPLLKGKKGDSGNEMDEAEDHPFSDAEHRAASSLL